MKVALQAAEELQKEGINADVIDLRTIRPLDFPTIVESVKRTNRLVIVEESWPYGSISSEITYQIQKHAFDYLDAPIKRVTGKDVSMSYAPTLVEAFLPNVKETIEAVKSTMYVKN
jgi:pyruvate dehydrogenase E1 component beta subunit